MNAATPKSDRRFVYHARSKRPGVALCGKRANSLTSGAFRLNTVEFADNFATFADGKNWRRCVKCAERFQAE